MASLPTVAAVAALCLASLLFVAEGAATKTKDDNFANTYINEEGEQREVADPVGDPSESDSIEQDGKEAWQKEMVLGLYAQRKAEKIFIDKLVQGGDGLNAMVNKITMAFEDLEKVRQERGSELIKVHFRKEIQLLNESSRKILSSLASLLTGQSSDSAAVKALKAQVTAIFSKGFSQQLKDESHLFQRQMKRIKAEHTRQNISVRELFALLKRWKETFQNGLKVSEKELESIAESWDLL